MSPRTFFKNDFPRVWYAVFGTALGASALFNPASKPGWVALKVVLIVFCFGFARLRPAEWWSFPRHRARQFSDYAAVSSGSKIASSTGASGVVSMALSSAMEASER